MNQIIKGIFRGKAQKTIAFMLSLTMLLTMMPSLALKAKADIPTITVTLNKPKTTDATNTKYTFSNATVSDYSGITSITFSATNGTTVDSLPSSPTPSSVLSSIDGTARVYTYVFENGTSSASAQSFIRGVVFHYVAGAQISVTVDANTTVLPTGANITKFAPPDDTAHDHYYMFVPFSGSTALSWSEAYNAAKTYRYMGMVGYLATITSQDENTILDNISMNGGWSGGSRYTGTYDGATAPNGPLDNEFKWCCGPESGTNYYYYHSPADKYPEDGAYNGFKDANEPNNYNGQGNSTDVLNSEWCMQIHHKGAGGVYTWNDLNNASTTVYVTGYFVEFSNYPGGMDENYASDKTAVNLYNLGTEGITTTPSIAVALNTPLTTDTTNTKYTFSNAAVTSNDSITSITFTGTNSTTIASVPTSPAPTSCLSSIDGTTRVYTYVFSAITSAQAQSFIRGVVFHYVAGAEISVTVDANKTYLPSGATITTFTHPDGSNHYYMYVPSDLISWTDAYNDAKSYTYMGMKGYLATVTSEQEDDILRNISTISAWSAGTRLLDSDSAKFLNPGSVSLTSNYADYYYWACGPEAGTIFYDGITASSHNGPSYTGYNDAYNNWGTTQPDANDGTETCVQVNWPFDAATTDMRWNDLPNEGLPYLGLVKGYFVEFSNYPGGMDATYSSDKTTVNLYDLGTGGIIPNATVTLNAPANLTYNGHPKDYTATVSGADLTAGTDYTLTYKGYNGTVYSDSTTAPKNAGNYTVTFALTAAGQAKCSVADTPTVNFTITPATLTVTPASGQSKLFGTADPASLSYTCSGNVSGETPAFTGALSRNTGDAIGSNYAITLGSLALTDGTGGFRAGNYTLAFSSTTVNFAVTAYTPTQRAALSSPNGDNGWFKGGVADIALTAPTGFTISTGGTLTTVDWASSIIVDKTDGSGKTAGYYLRRSSDGAISSALTGSSYKVDTAAPAVEPVSYGTDRFREFLHTLTFGLFFKDTVTVTLTAADTGSGVKEFRYTLNGVEKTAAATGGSATFTIPAPYKGNISGVKAVDNAGNVSDETTTEYFAADQQKPAAPTIDTNGYTPGTWTKDNVKLTVSGASVTSGIASYQYSADNGASWSGMTVTEKTDATATEPYNAVKAELTVNSDMNGSILVRAVGNSGIAGESASVPVKRDSVIPSLAVGITGTLGQWTESPLTFTLSNTANNLSPVTYWVRTGSEDWAQLSGSAWNVTGNVNTTYQFKAVSGSGLTSSLSDRYTVKFAGDTLKKVIEDIDDLPDPGSAPDKDITDNAQAIKDTKILYDTLNKDEQGAVGQNRTDKLNQLITRLNALLIIIPRDVDTGITAGNIGTSVKLPELNDPDVSKVVVRLAVDPIASAGTQSGANIVLASATLGQTGSNLVAAYDVSLIKSVFDSAGNQTSTGKVGNESIAGPITIQIPVPAGYQGRTDLQVAYIDGNGNVTPLATTLVTVDGVQYLQFTTTHFSVYAITAPSPVSNPKTGNRSRLPAGTTPLLEFGLFSATAVIVLRKKKNKKHETSL